MTLNAQTHLKKLTNNPLEKGILNLEDVVNQKFSPLYCTARNVKALYISDSSCLLCLTDLNWFWGRLASAISAQTSQKGIEYTKV